MYSSNWNKTSRALNIHDETPEGAKREAAISRTRIRLLYENAESTADTLRWIKAEFKVTRAVATLVYAAAKILASDASKETDDVP